MGVLVICILVFIVFCIVCTVFLYCFVCVYLFLFVLSVLVRGEFRPRQTRQLPKAVDLKGQLLSCQSY